MIQSGKSIYLFIVTFLIVALGGCDVNDTETPEVAEGHIQLQFVDEESGEPHVDIMVAVGTIYQGEEQIINRGTAQTDTQGLVEGVIAEEDTRVVETIVLLVQLPDGAEHEINLESTLELRFEEPYDTEEHIIEI